MDGSIGAIVITRSEKAFAANADNKEMQDNIFPSIIRINFIVWVINVALTHLWFLP